MTDHEFKAPERTAADPKTCTYCVEDAARLGARVEHLLGERERARDLAARLEQQVARVEALAVAVADRMMATAKPSEIWAALRGEGACEDIARQCCQSREDQP